MSLIDGMRIGPETDPVTGLDRWRIERAAGAGGQLYGLGWFATDIRTGVGAWQPSWPAAVAFTLGQIRAQAERIGWTLDDISDHLERRRIRATSRAGANRLREIAGLPAIRDRWSA